MKPQKSESTFSRSARLAFCACLVLMAVQGKAQQPPVSDIIPAAQRVQAPAFTIPGIDGKPVTLASTKGRVVLLDFWAIACGGCKQELPWYVSFGKKYGSQGLSLIGLDMYGESSAAVRAFAAAHGITYPLAIGTDAIGNLYHLQEMPLTVLIDRHGRIAVSHAGVVNPTAFEADVKTLLAEK